MANIHGAQVTRIRFEDDEPVADDVIRYEVTLDGVKIGTLAKGRECPAYSGIGSTYYPWAAYSVHPRATGIDNRIKMIRGDYETRTKAVAALIEIHRSMQSA